MPCATQSLPLKEGQSTVQTLRVCTDYVVPMGTYFGDVFRRPYDLSGLAIARHRMRKALG